jgi:hypothetical protein
MLSHLQRFAARGSTLFKQKWAGPVAIVPSERIVFWIITIYQNCAEVHNAMHRNFGGMAQNASHETCN